MNMLDKLNKLFKRKRSIKLYPEVILVGKIYFYGGAVSLQYYDQGRTIDMVGIVNKNFILEQTTEQEHDKFYGDKFVINVLGKSKIETTKRLIGKDLVDNGIVTSIQLLGD